MNRKYFSVIIVLFAAISPGYSAPAAEWQESNSKAIAAMRSGSYADAESLFQTSLSQAKDEADQKCIKSNLSLLYRKMGRIEEANKMDAELGLSRADEAPAPPPPAAANPAAANAVAIPDVAAEINGYNEKIQKALQTGKLPYLELLLDHKAMAIKHRDHADSMDYARTIYQRGSVLRKLNRKKEAIALEYQAEIINSRQRKPEQLEALIFPPVQPISTNSSISPMDFSSGQYSAGGSSNVGGGYNGDYTSASQSTYVDNAHMSTIDRNTTNIQRTSGATTTINSH